MSAFLIWIFGIFTAAIVAIIAGLTLGWFEPYLKRKPPPPRLARAEPFSRRRPLLQEIALAFYADNADKTPALAKARPLTISLPQTNIELPLIAVPGMIPDELLPLPGLRLEWDPAPPSFVRIWSELAESLRKQFGKTLHDDDSYRLVAARCVDGVPVLTCSPGMYGEYVESCEALNWMFALAAADFFRATFGHKEYKDKHGKLMIAKSLDIAQRSGEDYSQRLGFDPFDYLNRSACVGVNTLTVLCGAEESQFLLHQRGSPSQSDAQAANGQQQAVEAIDTSHVVPAGSFQPILTGDIAHCDEYRVEATITREFAEEVLSCDVDRNDRNAQSLCSLLAMPKYRRLRNTITFFSTPNTRVFFLGLTLDMLTLKPELLTLCLIDNDAFWQCFPGLKSNWEGNIERKPFRRDVLEEYLTDRMGKKVLAAAAGCIGLTLQHYDEVERAMGSLQANAR